MSIDKRKFPRIYRRAAVEFLVSDQKCKGTLVNFSEAGIFIESSSIFPPGTELVVPLNLAEGQEPTMMKGLVVWARKVDSSSSSHLKSGMGVHLNVVPNEYLEFVRECQALQKKNARIEDDRFEIFHRVTLLNPTGDSIEYTENISRGGVFLATERIFPAKTELNLRIEIHGLSKPVEVLGEVAYSLSPQKAKDSGRSAGLGIRFLDMDDASRAVWRFHLQRLKVHRLEKSRRREKDITMKGELCDISVPEILVSLHAKQFTGELIVQRRAITKIIFFKNGHPVYVDSNLYTETLGSYLLRKGLLTDTQILESLDTFSRSDLQYGEFLVASDLLSQSELTTSLVEHQEEKIANTFSWLEGTFEIIEDPDWSQKISILPLRIHHILFDGVFRWYDPNVISTWLGLDDFVAIKKNAVAIQNLNIPNQVKQILATCVEPNSLVNIATEFRIQPQRVYQIVYCLVLLGWVSFDFSGSKRSPTSDTQSTSSVPNKELMYIIKKWIEDDFNKLKHLNFYELLGISEDADEQEVTRAYLNQYARYNSYELEHVSSQDLVDKLSQIRSWIRLSYDVLRDPTLKSVYKTRTSNPPNKDLKAKRVESERMLLESMKAIQLGEFDSARLLLEKAIGHFPDNPILSGYLGWCMFQLDARSHKSEAIALIDNALLKEDQDPLLHYYRGEICFFQNDWQSAEFHFAQATRLKANFVKAQVALDVAREKMKGSSSEIQVIT